MKKKMSFVLLAFVAAGVNFPGIGEVAADAGIVVNGGFDEVKDGATVGWRNVGKRYVFRDGAGRNGSRGLCYENDDPTFYSFQGQNVALKAGRAYEFEVWVRTENLQGDESGATICIEWNDARGKWRGGAYPSGVKGTSGWTCVKGMTARIPADATSVRVNPYVRKGMTGKACFDDVSIREYVPPPVTGLYSTAYRNIAADGDVTFRTELDLPDGRAGCQLWFSYLDVTGKRHRVHTDNAMCESVTLPVSSLKMGRQDVVAELFRGTNCIGSATCAFTRVKCLPQRAVWFDKCGRTIVNGKPFFPLGMYWGAITTNKIETYAKGPFNCLMPYQAPKSTDLMDLCHEKGLKVIYSVKDIYHGTRWAPKGIASEEDEVRFIKDRVARFKDHPALLAWYLNDELPLSMLPRLTARRALMEELDPGHPGWTVLYQYTMIRDYMPSFDVVGTDPYPIPSKPAATATEWTRQTAGGTLGCKPVWQVPQAFNWAAYKKTPEEKAKHRAPTEAELRSMCWQCIANGANGLVLYSFFDLEKRPNGEDFDRRWAECSRVGAEIRGQFPVLLSEDGSRRLTWLDYEPPDDDWKGPKYPVSRRGWIKDGDLCVLVVNGYEKARHVRVGLADVGYSSAASVFGPAPKLVHGDGGDAVELDLAPLEPALVRLVKADASHVLLRRNCADPWLFRQDGRFYLTQTGTSKGFVEEAETLSGLSSPNCIRYLAYDAKSDPMLATLGYEGVSGVWSPEIHYFSEDDFPGNGGWYMFTALRDSAPGDSRHVKSIVLKSLSGKPEGPYGNPVNGAKFSSCLVLDNAGVPYPGWLVGQTVLRIREGEWKGVYSLFVSEVGRGTADFHQEIRIARLKTPWQMASETGIVTVPTQPWESIGSGPVEDPERRKKVPYLPRVVVFNPLPYARDAVVEVEVPDGGKTTFLAKDVPAGGHKTFPARPEAAPYHVDDGRAGRPRPADASRPLATPLHTRHFTVKFDLEKGGIASLVENTTGRELVKQGGHALGQFLHERFSLNEVKRFVYSYNRGPQRRLDFDFGKGGEITVTLPTGLKVTEARPVNLRGERAGEPIAVKDGKFSFELGAWSPKSFVLIDVVESATPHTFDKTLAYSRQLDVPRELPEDVIVYPMTTGDGRRLISYDVNGTAIRELVPANSIHSNNERK